MPRWQRFDSRKINRGNVKSQVMREFLKARFWPGNEGGKFFFCFVSGFLAVEKGVLVSCEEAVTLVRRSGRFGIGFDWVCFGGVQRGGSCS